MDYEFFGRNQKTQNKKLRVDANNNIMNPSRRSGVIPEYPPPKPRGSAVKRPPSQESDLQRAIREELSHCIEERNEYRKQLSNAREELIQTRAVAQTLQSYFRVATGTQPDVQKFVLDSIRRLQESVHYDKEMQQMQTALREEERKVRYMKDDFERQLAEKEKQIRGDLQQEVDAMVARANRRLLDAQYELESWQQHAEALRESMRNMRTHHNNLVLQYEALRTRRTLRDITNDPDDSLDENSVVWMDMDAQLIAAEDEKE